MKHCLVLFREAKKLTQDDLAVALGKFEGKHVAGNTVARWERGECLPQKKYREQIEKITGVSEDRLVADWLAVSRVREAAE